MTKISRFLRKYKKHFLHFHFPLDIALHGPRGLSAVVTPPGCFPTVPSLVKFVTFVKTSTSTARTGQDWESVGQTENT